LCGVAINASDQAAGAGIVVVGGGGGSCS